MVTVLGIAGSARASSHSRTLVKLALDSAQDTGARIDFMDLHSIRLPLYEPREEDIIPLISDMRERVAAAHALIIGTPEYHGCMSGSLKNLLDYLFPEINGKLIGFIVSSGSDSGNSTLSELRTLASYLRAWTLPYSASSSLADFDEAGHMINPRLRESLQRMGHDVAYYGELLYRAAEIR